jgi:RNA polymerase sigma-32 factor
MDPAMVVESADYVAHEENQLSEALSSLDARSRDIVARRWLSEPKATLHELGDEYGVSAERIRQLESNAMKKLRTGMLA